VSQNGSGGREWILYNIRFVVDSFQKVRTLVVVNHYDCGAYGGSAAFDSDKAQLAFQKEELVKAKALLAGHFPDLQIKAFFARFKDGQPDQVELLVV